MIEVKTCIKTTKCTAFEYNNVNVKLAKAPEAITRNKRVAIKCDHFRPQAQKEDAIIENTDAEK